MAPRAAARLASLGFDNVHEYRAGKHDWMAAGLPTEGQNNRHPRAADGARADAPTCVLGEPVVEVRRRAQSAGWDAAVAVDADGVVLGFLRSKELQAAGGRTVEEAMLSGPSTFRPYVPMKEIADYMAKHRLESAPITTSDGKLVGVLRRVDAERLAKDCPDCERKML